MAVSAIGTGGGSILRVDAQGVLKVGPESAGTDPGPVAYSCGGSAPTITDCYLITGLIDPALFLGGRLKLDREAAEALSRSDARSALPARILLCKLPAAPWRFGIGFTDRQKSDHVAFLSTF